MINESDRQMGQFCQNPDPVKAGLARAYHEIAQIWIKAYGDFPFPVAKTKPKEVSDAPAGSSDTSPSRLQPIPFAIEIPRVSPEVYAETRRAVETVIPNVFIATIQSDTMEDVLAKDLQREQRGKPRRLGFINESRTMRVTLPPAMEVFIDPQNFRIDNSNRLSTDAQKAKIAEEAAKISAQLPENVRRFVVWQMMDPSTVSQVEDQYMDTHNGELLMPDFFIRTDVQTVRGRVALVGRVVPSDRRRVYGWHRGRGRGDVFAGLMGVLPQKLAV